MHTMCLLVIKMSLTTAKMRDHSSACHQTSPCLSTKCPPENRYIRVCLDLLSNCTWGYHV